MNIKKKRKINILIKLNILNKIIFKKIKYLNNNVLILINYIN